MYLHRLCVWYLVGSADQVQVVAVQELADHISSEGEGDAAVILAPALDVLVWVRPQQIAQEAWRGGGNTQLFNSIVQPQPRAHQRRGSSCIHTGKQDPCLCLTFDQTCNSGSRHQILSLSFAVNPPETTWKLPFLKRY